MIVDDAEIRLAYTYAWWLTGDETAARSAVLAATARPDVPGADAGLRMEILLRRVRASAISRATMCPASELALLHDGIGLPLDSAAGLAMIDAREARTELAHGRLEALDGEADVEVVEPERLGGLAVGNPADVAAARQNPKLAALRDMILQGRDELVTLAEVTTPQDLIDEVATRAAARADAAAASASADEPADGTATADRPGTPGAAAARAGAGDRTADTGDRADPDDRADDRADDASPTTDILASLPIEQPGAQTSGRPRESLDAAEEIDLSDQVAEVSVPLGRPGGRGATIVWTVIGLALVVAVAVLVTSGGGDDVVDAPTLNPPTPDTVDGDAVAGDAADGGTDETVGTPADGDAVAGTEVPGVVVDTSTDDPTDPGADPTDAADAGDDPDADALAGLQVDAVGVAVGLGADPSEEAAPTATPFDPISFVITYRNAEPGDALVATWTVDGTDFGTERVDLLPGGDDGRTSRFSRQVPSGSGWPVGQHLLVFREVGDDTPLAEATFTILQETP